jgi:mRNA-degrading endonuclease RelE of RelBE toxin-antitoxin system
MYEVVILNSAAKQLRNFDKPIKNKIITTLEKIAQIQITYGLRASLVSI